MLDLSKIEAGKMELYLETFEVGPLVRDVAAVLEPLAQKNANRLEVQCAPDVGAMRADLTKFRQALLQPPLQRLQVHGAGCRDGDRDAGAGDRRWR